MSQYQAGPRLGHLEVLYNVFAYLKKHMDMGKLAYDLKTPEVDESAFNNNADCKYFYGDLEEELPPKMPEPCGNVVRIVISSMLTMLELSLLIDHIQVSSSSCRTLRLFGF